jgi:cobalt-zinc-cadmium efflux system outer membrane protein
MTRLAKFSRFVAVPLLAVTALAGTREITLDRALELFYRNNFDIIIHKYEVDKATAEVVGARLLSNPSVSFDYTDIQFGRGGIFIGDNTQWTVRLDQLIEIGGKRGLRKGVAASNLEASRFGHQDLIRNLLIGFYSLFNDLVLDDLNVSFVREEIENLDKVLAVSDRRYAAGFLTLIDHEKLKLSRLELENELTRLENQSANDLELFRVLLGSSEPLKPFEPPLKPDFVDYDVEALIHTANQNRHDLLALEKQVGAAQYAVRLARAAAKPNLTVGVEYDSLGPGHDPAFGVGVGLDLPLFNRNQKDILLSKSQLGQLQAQLEKTRRQIDAEVRQGLNNYRSAFKVFDSYRSRERELKELLSKSRQAFSLGGITVLDLMDTEKTYRDFMLKYHQALVQCRLDQELLKVYTGGIP